MRKVDYKFLKVSFSEFYTFKGKRLKPGLNITGDLVQYTDIRTINGIETAGIVIGDDCKIYFVPELSIVKLI